MWKHISIILASYLGKKPKLFGDILVFIIACEVYEWIAYAFLYIGLHLNVIINC
jgi:hypothetical protein